MDPIQQAMMMRQLGSKIPLSKGRFLRDGGMGGMTPIPGRSAADLLGGPAVPPATDMPMASPSPPMGDPGMGGPPPEATMLPAEGSAPIEGNILDGASAGLSPEVIQESLSQSGAAPPTAAVRPAKAPGGGGGFQGEAMGAGLNAAKALNPFQKPQDQFRGAMMSRMLNPFGWGRK